MQQSVDGADADEGPEGDDLDDLAVDDLLHLRIEGQGVELGLVVDPWPVRNYCAFADVVNSRDRDDRPHLLVHPPL